MFEITSISSGRIGRTPVASGPQQPARRLAVRDAVELSRAARGATDPRDAARIKDLRQRIATGTYLSADKLDYVTERLHAELHAARAYVA